MPLCFAASPNGNWITRLLSSLLGRPIAMDSAPLIEIAVCLSYKQMLFDSWFRIELPILSCCDGESVHGCCQHPLRSLTVLGTLREACLCRGLLKRVYVPDHLVAHVTKR
jgi:hypothetical protein